MATVEHDEDRRRFVIRMGEDEAALKYVWRDPHVVEFYHVYVPPAFRNRGYAGRILIHAFDWARERGVKVVPTCPFIAGDFLPRFPKYYDLIEDGG